MKKKKNRKIKNRILLYLYNTVLFAILIGFVLLFRFVDRKNNEPVSWDFELGKPSESSTIHGQIEKAQEWTDQGRYGAEFRMLCINDMDANVVNWSATMDVPTGARIDSSWNGTFEIEGNTLHYTPDWENAVVYGHNQRTFGLVMYTNAKYLIHDLHIVGYVRYDVYGMPAFWALVAALVIAVIVMLMGCVLATKERKFMLKQKQDQKTIIQTMKTFVNFIDAKDSYTSGHSLRVATYSADIARRMGKDQKEIENIFYVALMHDAGKIGIPDEILTKPGKLTPEERDIIQSHTLIAGNILKDFTSIPYIMDGAKFHHERYDGGGYPVGLVGKEIPEYGRIICIADSYDAMSTDRCYRKRLPNEVILDELRSCAGRQFDPDIVPYMVAFVESGCDLSELRECFGLTDVF